MLASLVTDFCPEPVPAGPRVRERGPLAEGAELGVAPGRRWERVGVAVPEQQLARSDEPRSAEPVVRVVVRADEMGPAAVVHAMICGEVDDARGVVVVEHVDHVVRDPVDRDVHRRVVLGVHAFERNSTGAPVTALDVGHELVGDEIEVALVDADGVAHRELLDVDDGGGGLDRIRQK